MKKRTLIVVIVSMLIMLISNSFIYANINPSREELEEKIEEVAVKRGVPAVLLKSIARVESVFQHYDDNGNVFRGSSGSIGLMQIYNAYNNFDTNKLMYDIDYNIEAGVEMLLSKWDMSAEQRVSNVGNMDPNVLENWYFALWAYNGWVESNNPNMLPYHYRTWIKDESYQELIFMVADEEYDQQITNIDASYLPNAGLPSKNLNVPTPGEINYAGIIQYNPNDLVEVDTFNVLNLRDAPSGNVIGSLQNGQIMTVQEGPKLENGYYWYKLVSQDGALQGWAARNWLIRVGDTENGIYPFEDLAYNWSRDYVMKLYNKGLISGYSETLFLPDKFVDREVLSAFICKVLELPQGQEDQFKDINEISSWALEYLNKVCDAGIFKVDDGFIKPKKQINRREAALIFSRIFENYDNGDEQAEEEPYKDVELSFEDLEGLTEEEVNAIKIVYKNNIMNGKYETLFCPEDFITRAEAAVIMYRLLETIE